MLTERISVGELQKAPLPMITDIQVEFVLDESEIPFRRLNRIIYLDLKTFFIAVDRHGLSSQYYPIFVIDVKSEFLRFLHEQIIKTKKEDSKHRSVIAIEKLYTALNVNEETPFTLQEIYYAVLENLSLNRELLKNIMYVLNNIALKRLSATLESIQGFKLSSMPQYLVPVCEWSLEVLVFSKLNWFVPYILYPGMQGYSVDMEENIVNATSLSIPARRFVNATWIAYLENLSRAINIYFFNNPDIEFDSYIEHLMVTGAVHHTLVPSKEELIASLNFVDSEEALIQLIQSFIFNIISFAKQNFKLEN